MIRSDQSIRIIRLYFLIGDADSYQVTENLLFKKAMEVLPYKKSDDDADIIKNQ